MVVVDSSALIPLSWVGELSLITDAFDEINTTEEVREEVLIGGKRGTAALEAFLDGTSIHQAPADTARMAELEGIAFADAAVIGLAKELSDLILANDKALIEVARSQVIDYFWVTTLLLQATKTGSRSPDEASDILYRLVDNGMNLHPKVYSRVHRALDNNVR